MCQSRTTIFPGILFFVIFRPRDMQEYICMFIIELKWTVNSMCDHLISNWCYEFFQMQYIYLLNRSSAWNSLSKISRSATLFTNKYIRRRNIAFLQTYHLQIWQLSIANENTCYIIIALEYVIKFVGDFQQVGCLLRLLRFSPPIKLTSTI